MNPEQLSNYILAGVGVLLQLAFMYVPRFKDWYANHPNKGLVALGFNVAFAGVYFALACVPVLASLLGIALTCDLAGGWTLLQAIFILATSQQLAYLFTKNLKK